MTLTLEALGGPIVAILNSGSGSCDAQSQKQVEAAFELAGLENVEVLTVEPADLSAALDAAVAKAKVLVVLGGDGTIGTAASRCGASGPLLIPLPGGTMNMLPKSLYGSLNWSEALAATLAAPHLQRVSGGDLNGHRFYCAAILGAPSLWADAREAVREGRVMDAAKTAAIATRRSLADTVDYDFGLTTGSADAISVICPLVSQALADQEAALEAVALDPKTAADLFGLAFHAAFDDWRNDPSVTCTRTRNVRVTGNGPIPAILDGEPVRVGLEALVTYVPVAFRALTPSGPCA